MDTFIHFGMAAGIQAFARFRARGNRRKMPIASA
jgi:hypothetical protein